MHMEAKYGRVIREMRKAYGLTQIQLAEKAEIAVNSLRRYESNERQPTNEIMEQLAGAVGISLPEFFIRFPRRLEEMSSAEISTLMRSKLVAMDEDGKYHWTLPNPVNGSVLEKDDCKDELDDFEFADALAGQAKPVEPMPVEFDGLNEILHQIGRHIEKVDGKYYFTGEHGGGLVSEEDIMRLLNQTKDWVEYFCAKLEKRLMDDMSLRGHIKEPKKPEA